MKIQTNHCLNAADWEFPATDPANAPARAEFKLGIFPPDHHVPPAAIAAFGKVMNTPRGQIVNKSALLREVETDTAALVQLATDMDDLALQFDGTDAGKRFIEAWKRARIIVDTGGGHSGTPPTPPTPPATPKP